VIAEICKEKITDKKEKGRKLNLNAQSLSPEHLLLPGPFSAGRLPPEIAHRAISKRSAL